MRQYSNFVFAGLLMMMVTVSGCKKESDTAPTLNGSWRVINSTIINHDKHYIFSDGQLSVCTDGDDDFRYVQHGVYEIEGNNILYSYESTSGSSFTELWRTIFSGDTLFILKNNSDYNVTLLRDKSPATSQEWVKQATVLNRTNLNAETYSLAYYDGYVYYDMADFGNDNIYLVNDATLKVTDSIQVAFGFNGIEFYGNRLFVGQGNKVTEVSQVTGAALLNSPPSSSGNYYYFCCNGVELYAYQVDFLHAYYPDINSFYGGTRCAEQIDDLAFANGYLYMIKDGAIHQCYESIFSAKQSFEIPNFKPQGLAFDGTYFWCSGKNISNGDYELLKLTLAD